MINKNFLISLILIALGFSSCEINDTSVKTNHHSGELELDEKDSTLNLLYNFNPKKDEYWVEYNKSSGYLNQKYVFDGVGNLTEKTGMNFFGEMETYNFDGNNSLVEYRKLIDKNHSQKSLQEFIHYRNGIIDKRKSHYFDFSIIDSSASEYKIRMDYLGSFSIENMKILVGDFSKYSDELKFNVVTSTKESSIEFWAKKADVFDSELGFFQINAEICFNNTGGLMETGAEGTSPKKCQNVILRKLKTDVLGID